MESAVNVFVYTIQYNSRKGKSILNRKMKFVSLIVFYERSVKFGDNVKSKVWSLM